MNNIKHISVINSWLHSLINNVELPSNFLIKPIQGDASVRKYYILLDPTNDDTLPFIIMQSPNDNDLKNFINIANYLNKLNLPINIPKIFAVHNQDNYSYILLDHLGDDLLYNIINIHNARYIYKFAWHALANIQLATSKNKTITIPSMNREYISKNLLIFKEWYLETHLKLHNIKNLNNILNHLENYFTNIFQDQPQVFVHLDYHSKNLILNSNILGIIDFQDAMRGPITYDIVSLLQDAYLVWPENLAETILLDYFNHIQQLNSLKFQEFLRYFYLTGLQRHIKNLGVFARLKYFYKKNIYLQYIPNLLIYIHKTCNKFNDKELSMLKNLLPEIAMIKD